MNYSSYDYYYGDEAEQYVFYRIPKMLFIDERFKGLSAEAKILYGLMLDRMGLSIKNGWRDERNRIFILFTIEDIQEQMNCGHNKGVKIIGDLEKSGLIERVRQGQGKPSKIYLKKFTNADNACRNSDFPKKEFKTSEKGNSRLPEKGTLDFPKRESNKNYFNNNELNKISYPYPIRETIDCGADKRTPEEEEGNGREWTDSINNSVSEVEEGLKQKIEYEVLCHNFGQACVDEIVGLIVEVLLSTRRTIRIASDDRPAALVKERFNCLNSNHIEFVLTTFQENSSDVRNIKQYMLASLFNAPISIESYYHAKYNSWRL